MKNIEQPSESSERVLERPISFEKFTGNDLVSNIDLFHLALIAMGERTAVRLEYTCSQDDQATQREIDAVLEATRDFAEEHGLEVSDIRTVQEEEGTIQTTILLAQNERELAKLGSRTKPGKIHKLLKGLGYPETAAIAAKTGNLKSHDTLPREVRESVAFRCFRDFEYSEENWAQEHEWLTAQVALIEKLLPDLYEEITNRDASVAKDEGAPQEAI